MSGFQGNQFFAFDAALSLSKWTVSLSNWAVPRGAVLNGVYYAGDGSGGAGKLRALNISTGNQIWINTGLLKDPANGNAVTCPGSLSGALPQVYAAYGQYLSAF